MNWEKNTLPFSFFFFVFQVTKRYRERNKFKIIFSSFRSPIMHKIFLHPIVTSIQLFIFILFPCSLICFFIALVSLLFHIYFFHFFFFSCSPLKMLWAIVISWCLNVDDIFVLRNISFSTDEGTIFQNLFTYTLNIFLFFFVVSFIFYCLYSFQFFVSFFFLTLRKRVGDNWKESSFSCWVVAYCWQMLKY